MNAAKAKRGDLVALETKHVTTYVIGSGKPSETRTCFKLVRVAKASRTGEVMAIEEIGYGTVRQLKHLAGYNYYQPRVHCIPTKQVEAQRLIDSLSQDALNAGWDSAESIKAAILAVEAAN
jgi:hypothetical protein